MTKSEEWDRQEQEIELEQPDPAYLSKADNTQCDHERKPSEGQCLLCLFGDTYDNPEELE